MDNKMKYEQVRNKLNEKSSSLCLAKWLQVTINLQNGTGHSCHHPIVHKIPLKEIENDPSALHNTEFKKLQQSKMKQNERPEECNYCWRIEDSSKDNFSDRTLKSAEHWAEGKTEEIWNLKPGQNINPTYVEVSFGSECNFKCAYCSPHVSSAIQAEYNQHGPYTSLPYFDLNKLKEDETLPIPKDQHNPYVEAFWKWWPDLIKDLKVFRITGGEPLLNANTFRLLEHLSNSPQPVLDLAVNTNLGVPQVTLDKFLKLSQTMLDRKAVNKFEIYTSIDTFGKQAEYIRFGLDSESFWKNVDKTMTALPDNNVVVMCTFNALSFFSFPELLQKLAEYKVKYRSKDGQLPRLQLSTSFLRYPVFMAPESVPPEHLVYLEKALDFMLRNSRQQENIIFTDLEILQVRRILEMLRKVQLTIIDKENRQIAFYQFFKEYDARKGSNFIETFPELKSYFEEGKSLKQQKVLARN